MALDPGWKGQLLVNKKGDTLLTINAWSSGFSGTPNSVDCYDVVYNGATSSSLGGVAYTGTSSGDRMGTTIIAERLELDITVHASGRTFGLSAAGRDPMPLHVCLDVILKNGGGAQTSTTYNTYKRQPPASGTYGITAFNEAAQGGPAPSAINGSGQVLWTERVILQPVNYSSFWVSPYVYDAWGYEIKKIKASIPINKVISFSGNSGQVSDISANSITLWGYAENSYYGSTGAGACHIEQSAKLYYRDPNRDDD